MNSISQRTRIAQRHTVALVADDDRDELLVDTLCGSILRVASRFFLVTAAHGVVRDQPTHPWGVLVADENEGQTVTLNVEVREGIAIEDEDADAAVLELVGRDDRAQAALERASLPLEAIELLTSTDPRLDLVLVAGYPRALTSTIGGEMLGMISCTLARAGTRGFPEHPSAHRCAQVIPLAVDIDDVERLGLDLPALSGVSGCPYWIVEHGEMILVGAHRSSSPPSDTLGHAGKRVRFLFGTTMQPFIELLTSLDIELAHAVQARWPHYAASSIRREEGR